MEIQNIGFGLRELLNYLNLMNSVTIQVFKLECVRFKANSLFYYFVKKPKFKGVSLPSVYRISNDRISNIKPIH